MVSSTPVSSKKVNSSPFNLIGIKTRLLINLKGITTLFLFFLISKPD
jgi:hypothetical protein